MNVDNYLCASPCLHDSTGANHERGRNNLHAQEEIIIDEIDLYKLVKVVVC